jgi:hypothetical protein
MDKKLIREQVPKGFHGLRKDEFERDRVTLKCLAMRMEHAKVNYIPDEEYIYFIGGSAARLGFWASAALAVDLYGFMDINPVIPMMVTLGWSYCNIASENSIKLADAREAILGHM